MKETLFNGTRFWLLDLIPDWSSSYRLTVRRPVAVEPALNSHEIRRPTGETIRFRQDFIARIDGAKAQAVEKWLARHLTDPVAVPLWPALSLASENMEPFRAALWLAVSGDYQRTEVFDVYPPAWRDADTMVCPLLLGRIESRKIRWDTPESGGLNIAFIESGPAQFAVSVAEFSPPEGPVHDPSGTPPFALFPGKTEFVAPDQESVVDIERGEIGFGRTPEEVARGTPSREFSVECYFDTRTELAQLLSFFAERTSAVPFWVPSPSAPLSIISSLPDGGVVIAGDGSEVESGDWLAFHAPGDTATFAKVAQSYDEWIKVALPPGRLIHGDTNVSRLQLVRFRTDRLTIEFDAPGHGDVKVDVRQLPAEEDPADGTNAGTTIGAAPSRVWLYEIANGDEAEHWTSAEDFVGFGGFEYEPARITHGEVTSSISGARDSVSVRVGLSVSELIRAAISRKVTGALRITINEVEAGGGVPRTVFTGEVSRIQMAGQTVTLSCQPWPAASTLRIPRFRVQPGCNHVLFRPGCGLNPSSWRWAAVVSTPGGEGYPFVFGLSGLSGPVPVTEPNWFAGGWIEVSGDKVPIRSSTAPASGALSVTLARDPRSFPEPGAAAALFPGCDGRWETCGEKFANRINFGGHPHVPKSNPSLVKLSSTFNGGKK